MLPIAPATLDAMLLPVCLALLVLAACHDAIARTIPNWIPASLALVALVEMLRSQAAWSGLLAAALLFAACVSLWRFGWLGGGDAKLLGAIGLLVPPGRLFGTVTMIALAGGVLALPYIACRGRIGRPARVRPAGLAARAVRAERFRLRRGGPLPYAIAIAVGTGCTLLGGLFGGPP
jgi:prepilin peptidase CpaA